MKFVLSIDVTESDTTADITEKLERLASYMREKSVCSTFLEDASGGGGPLGKSIGGTWKIDSGETEWVCPMCEALGNTTHVPEMECMKHCVLLVRR